MKTKILMLVLVLLFSLVVVGAVLAANGVEISRWVLGSGVVDSSSGNISMRATLGQPIVGNVSGDEVTVGQGAWYGGEIPESGFHVYLPLLRK